MARLNGTTYLKKNNIFIKDENGDYIMKNGKIVPLTKKIAFSRYQSLIRKLTNINAKNLELIHLRGFYTYHIDHKISIYFGFNNKISPEDIAHISNLEMTSMEYNLSKRIKCNIDLSNRWIIEKYNLII